MFGEWILKRTFLELCCKQKDPFLEKAPQQTLFHLLDKILITEAFQTYPTDIITAFLFPPFPPSIHSDNLFHLIPRTQDLIPNYTST